MYAPNQRPSNGVLVLVLGILAWVGCSFFTGIPAWIIGNNSLRDIDRGYADPSDRGLVQAGRILGIINVILCMAAVALWLMVILVFGGISATMFRQIK